MDDVQATPREARHVRRVQALERVTHDARDHRKRRQVAGLSGSTQQRRETFAMNVFHDHQQLALLGDHVERSDDVGMVDRRGEPRLVEEHGHELALERELRVQALDGHELGKPCGPEHAPEVHRRHAARGELGVDSIAAYRAVHARTRLRCFTRGHNVQA